MLYFQYHGSNHVCFYLVYPKLEWYSKNCLHSKYIPERAQSVKASTLGLCCAELLEFKPWHQLTYFVGTLSVSSLIYSISHPHMPLEDYGVSHNKKKRANL